MLTRSGLGTTIGSIVLGLVGLLFGYDEFVIAGGAGLAVVAGALVVATRQAGVTAARVHVPERVARGATLRLQAQVVVAGRLSGSIVLLDRFGDRELTVAVPTVPALPDRGDAEPSSRRPRLARRSAGAAASSAISAGVPVVYETRADRRGVVALGPLGTRHGDPFGLASARHSVEGSAAEIVVHPRLVSLDPQRLVERPAEVEAARRRGASDPAAGFHSLRPYIPGDDTRSVHWPTTARTGVVMVREYTAQVRPSLAIVLLTSEYHGDRFEDAADIAASIAITGLREGLEVTLRTSDPAAAGSPQPVLHPAAALDLLGRCQTTAADRTDLAGVFHGLHRVTTAFVISGRAEEGAGRFGEIAEEVIVVSVVDVDGARPRLIGGRAGGVAVNDADMFASWWRSSR